VLKLVLLAAVILFALDDGQPLVRGKTVTGFANIEEDSSDQAVRASGQLPRDQHVMSWRIENELKKLGANYIQAGPWRGFAVRDGNLITGQQNFSGAETADVVIDALGR
jgi:putative intracellular protease/amidase